MKAETDAAADPAHYSPSHGAREAGSTPAHDDHGTTSNQTVAYVTANAVAEVARRG